MGQLRPHCLGPGGPKRCVALLNDAEPVALLSYAVRCLGPLDLSDATQSKLHERCMGRKFSIIFSNAMKVFFGWLGKPSGI